MGAVLAAAILPRKDFSGIRPGFYSDEKCRGSVPETIPGIEILAFEKAKRMKVTLM